MITKYAIYNPFTGENVKVNSLEDAQNLVVSNILEQYKNYTHNNFYTEISVDEDGNETWVNNSQSTELPEDIIAKIKSGLFNVQV